MSGIPWTETEVEIITALWARGLSAKEIAAHPGLQATCRRPQSVWYKANQLGLPRRYGRGGGWREDPEQRAEKVRLLYVDLGWPIYRIATKIGAHANTIASIIRARNYKRGAMDIPHPQAKKRPCMTCGKMFWSQNNGVRMCDYCRAHADAGIEDYSIHGWAAA